MKHLLIILISILTLSPAFAQDIIAHKDGNVTMGKVTEISKEKISYKRADNPEGPTYTLDKEDLLSIRFANGTQEIFEKKVVVDEDDRDEEEENGESYFAFRPELRLRLDAPACDIVDGGGGVVFVAGVQVNQYLSMGPGIGILGHAYSNRRLHAFEVPVFVQGRMNLSRKPLTPYLIGQAGYTFGNVYGDDHQKYFNEEDGTHLGFYTSVGLGCRLKLKRGSLFFDLTWNRQAWSASIEAPKSFGISGGYFFEPGQRRH